VVVELWRFSVEGVGLPSNFQRPLAAKLCDRPPNVLEVQRTCSKSSITMPSVHGWAPISLAAAAAKNVSFFVCLFVRHPSECQSLCARFCHECAGV